MNGPLYPFRSFEIAEFARLAKRSRLRNPKPQGVGSLGLKLDLILDVEGISLQHRPRLILQAGRMNLPASYKATLILANERVRGVDYEETGKKRFCKTVIPKGWHQNLVDPNLPVTDPNRNRHEPMPGWSLADFSDFIAKICQLWNVDIGREETLL